MAEPELEVAESEPDGAEPGMADAAITRVGTTQRFVLLVVLFVTTSFAVTTNMVTFFFPGIDARWGDCMLASGYNYYSTGAASLANTGYYKQIAACEGAGSNRYWQAPLLTCAVLVAAYLLYRFLPRWKSRRSRYAPVSDVDPGGTIRPLLDACVEEAGLGSRPPDFVVDPAAVTASAAAFGTHRSATVCLHGGLLAKAATDPGQSRQVVLHELAHVRNRDIGLTYATVAIWRVFLVLILVSEVCLDIANIVWARRQAGQLGSFSTLASIYVIDLVQVVLMPLLIFLTRADILRVREICADATAARWTQRPLTGPAAEAAAAPHPGRARRLAGGFLALWRPHPAWVIRRNSQADPAPLVTASALTMFLTGTAVSLACIQLNSYLPGTGQSNTAEAGILAGLTVAIAGGLLWRSAQHAASRNRRMPYGWRAGLWLGIGLAFGELTDSNIVGPNWYPSQPEGLLVFVAISVLLMAWLARYAEARASRMSRAPGTAAHSGRYARVTLVVGFAVPWLVLTFFYYWWLSEGDVIASTWPTVAGQLRAMNLPGVPVHHPDQIVRIAAELWTFPGSQLEASAIWWAIPLLWLAPLAALGRRGQQAKGPGPAARVWSPQVLVSHAGLIGGLAACAGVLAVRAWGHTQQQLIRASSDYFELSYITWITLAVGLAAIMASVLVAALGQGRRVLLDALIAGGITATMGMTLAVALTPLDGCLGPLDMRTLSCGWHPRLLNDVGIPIASVLCTALIAAALAVTAIDLVRSRTGRLAAAPGQPRPRQDAAAAPAPGRRRVTVSLLSIGTIALIVLVAQAEPLFASDSSGYSSAGSVFGTVRTTTPPDVAQMELDAWARVGGTSLLSALADADNAVYGTMVDSGHVPPAEIVTFLGQHLPRACASLSSALSRVSAFFPVPLASGGQGLWIKTIQAVQQVSADCTAVAHVRTVQNITALVHDLKASVITFNNFGTWFAKNE